MVVYHFIINFEKLNIDKINEINYFTNSAFATRNLVVKLNKSKISNFYNHHNNPKCIQTSSHVETKHI